MEILFSSSGSRALDAKRCKSSVSVVPVLFAPWNRWLCRAKAFVRRSGETKFEISETLKVFVLSSEQFGDCRRGTPTHPYGESFNEFEVFRICF